MQAMIDESVWGPGASRVTSLRLVTVGWQSPISPAPTNPAPTLKQQTSGQLFIRTGFWSRPTSVGFRCLDWPAATLSVSFINPRILLVSSRLWPVFDNDNDNDNSHLYSALSSRITKALYNSIYPSLCRYQMFAGLSLAYFAYMRCRMWAGYRLWRHRWHKIERIMMTPSLSLTITTVLIPFSLPSPGASFYSCNSG